MTKPGNVFQGVCLLKFRGAVPTSFEPAILALIGPYASKHYFPRLEQNMLDHTVENSPPSPLLDNLLVPRDFVYNVPFLPKGHIFFLTMLSFQIALITQGTNL
jgi:hypothetical protein